MWKKLLQVDFPQPWSSFLFCFGCIYMGPCDNWHDHIRNVLKKWLNILLTNSYEGTYDDDGSKRTIVGAEWKI
jgi:hypothetical protein